MEFETARPAGINLTLALSRGPGTCQLLFVGDGTGGAPEPLRGPAPGTLDTDGTLEAAGHIGVA